MQSQRFTRLIGQMAVIAALVTSTLLVGSYVGAQEVPQVLPYQGYLAQANGTPVEGTVSLHFKLYETSQDQNYVWSETIENVVVVDGVFYVYLGQQTDIINYFADGTNRYLGIAVNNDAEATPRLSLGSVPYALLAGNAQKLGGYESNYFATQNQLNNYVTDAELNAALNGYVTNGDLNNYVTNAELTTALNNVVNEVDLTNYVTQNQLNNYVTQNQLNGYVTSGDLNNYVTNAALTQQLNNYVTNADLNGYVTDAELAQAINGLQATVTNLQNTVNTLQTTVNNLEVNNGGNAGPAYILGVAKNGNNVVTTNGRPAANGKVGMEGATELCKNSYGANARMCTQNDLIEAVSTGSWDTNNANFISNRAFWTYSVDPFTNGAFEDTCLGLSYPTGDLATGRTMAINLNNVFNGRSAISWSFANAACSTAQAIMCCR